MVSVKKSVKKGKLPMVQKVTKPEKLKKAEPVVKGIKKVMKAKTNALVTPIKPETIIKNSKKVKYVMPSKSITGELVDKCLTALQQLTATYKNKNTILEDEVPIFAEIHCMKIQNTTANIKL